VSKQLFAAMAKRSFKGIQAAIAAGADIDAIEPEDGFTALAWMCKSKSGVMSKTETECALWLIEHGADVMKPNNDAETPMHLVAGNGSVTVLDALVAKGATVTKTKLDYTPLHYCMTTHDKDTKMWDRLIELGCNIEDKNKWGHNALTNAVSSHNPTAVKYLLARGADPTVKDSKGRTPLEMAREYKNEKLIKLLDK
jgi:ankyrin repeat protein